MHQPIDEVRRLRAELDAKTAELRELQGLVSEHFAAETGPQVDLETARQWGIDSYERGRAEAVSMPPVEDLDIDPPGEFPNELDQRRIDELDRLKYPPDGRKAFGLPREGDFEGGPVEWPEFDAEPEL